MPSGRAPAVIAWAQRTPRAGPSKVAKTPARGVDFPAAEPRQLAAGQCIVGAEHVAPLTVAEGGGSLRRANDVGEEYGCQHSIEVDLVTGAGQKLLNGIQDGVGIPHPWNVVHAGELDELGTRNVFGQVTCLLYPGDAIQRDAARGSAREQPAGSGGRRSAGSFPLPLLRRQGWRPAAGTWPTTADSSHHRPRWAPTYRYPGPRARPILFRCVRLLPATPAPCARKGFPGPRRGEHRSRGARGLMCARGRSLRRAPTSAPPPTRPRGPRVPSRSPLRLAG